MKNRRFNSIALGLFAALAFLAPAPTVYAEDVVSSGTFSGRSDHKMAGKVEIIKSGDGYLVKLGEDFYLDGAPDPKLRFGKDGYKKSTQFSKLNKKKGSQTYNLPKDLDPSAYNEIWVWCEKFNVPLGVAKLK